jgi:hypothetical protein
MQYPLNMHSIEHVNRLCTDVFQGVSALQIISQDQTPIK